MPVVFDKRKLPLPSVFLAGTYLVVWGYCCSFLKLNFLITYALRDSGFKLFKKYLSMGRKGKQWVQEG